MRVSHEASAEKKNTFSNAGVFLAKSEVALVKGFQWTFRVCPRRTTLTQSTPPALCCLCQSVNGEVNLMVLADQEKLECNVLCL